MVSLHFGNRVANYIGCIQNCKLRRPDDGSGKTSTAGAGGMGFKSRADQISHTLPTTRYRCNLEVWALAQSRGDGHRSIVTPEGD